jgi:hypothetical protein
MGGKKTLMSPRVINWGMLVKQSVGPRTKADLPPGSYHQCAQKVTDVEYLRLRNVSGDEHHSELLRTNSKPLCNARQIPNLHRVSSDTVTRE